MQRNKIKVEDTVITYGMQPYLEYGIDKKFKCEDCNRQLMNAEVTLDEMLKTAKNRGFNFKQPTKVVCERCVMPYLS